MMTNQEIDKRVERAVENFMAGYGCCQSVVAAFADLYGLDDTLAKRLAAGFGGGGGRCQGVQRKQAGGGAEGGSPEEISSLHNYLILRVLTFPSFQLRSTV